MWKRIKKYFLFLFSALKESGYESDSTLIFRRREDVNSLSPLSPLEQRLAYKTVQKGGDVPLHGLRKPAPERPKGKFLNLILRASIWVHIFIFSKILIFFITNHEEHISF